MEGKETEFEMEFGKDPYKKFKKNLEKYDLNLQTLRDNKYSLKYSLHLNDNIDDNNGRFADILNKYLFYEIIHNCKPEINKYECICDVQIKHLHFITNAVETKMMIIGSKCAECFVPYFKKKLCKLCGTNTQNRKPLLCNPCRLSFDLYTKKMKDFAKIILNNKKDMEKDEFKKLLKKIQYDHSQRKKNKNSASHQTQSRATKKYLQKLRLPHKNNINEFEDYINNKYIFKFGKHKYKGLPTVYKEDPQYVKWLLNSEWFKDKKIVAEELKKL